MLRSSCGRLAGPKPKAQTWKTRLLEGLSKFVGSYVPDPRNDPMAERPVGYESFKDKDTPKLYTPEYKQGETLEDYMRQRNERWMKTNVANNLPPTEAERKELGIQVVADGKSIFKQTGDKSVDVDPEAQNAKLKELIDASSTFDEEKIKLRRQLQVENAEEYRKFVAEVKRSDLQEQNTMRRRTPHPADPKYDPFKHTPGYRPQDSTKLAAWLKRQRESGVSASGADLSTREGQERFYNEEKMATQYHANPFGNHIEVPRGLPKMLITHLSPDSICISEKEVIGSIILTQNRYYHWNASTIEDINTRTLSVLLHLYPPPDVVFIGTGRNLYMLDEDLRLAFARRGTAAHTMTTREACSNFGLMLTQRRRTACALLACVPTNSYGKECFGDFIENDSYCLSDTQLGIRPNRQFNPALYKTNKIAEPYRHMVGTGIGPKYHVLPDGRMVRPGTHGTKLRPLLEPGETVDWEKLPSYYHWFPKETVEDYLEKRTWREVKTAGIPEGEASERRLREQYDPNQPHSAQADEQPKADLMPWDSNTIPMPVWQHEKVPGEITVEDPKTGRIIGMTRPTYEKWKTMMERRKQLEAAEDAGMDVKGVAPEAEEVEFDQEKIVSERSGRLIDLSKTRYIPLHEHRWNPKGQRSTQRGNVPFPH
jgi:NADH dehydrogenase [ubiquinone] 1 alpha subcomplex assembly factor 3